MDEELRSFEENVLPSLVETEGVDTTLIEYNLSLSINERLLNHQRALETVNELLKARKQVYGESESPTQAPA